MTQIQISKRPFSEVDINDPFFDSLKADYKGFTKWFEGKAQELAYVGYDSKNNVRAFVYLKREDETVTDVTPHIPAPCLKVGTLLIFQIFTKQCLAKLVHCMAWNYQAAKQKTFGSTGD
ncbi:hypothetical protein, partial [uncultured Desulfovibrio sp.]|uniref:hypothetical protein n=2 Tax=uncultured Desulfovibrio sp. TaxID=167968 RepID=UPI00261DCE6F